MPLSKGLAKRLNRFKSGLDSGYEFLVACTGQAFGKLAHKMNSHYEKAHIRRLKRKALHGDGIYHIKDVKLPLLDKENERLLFCPVYEDTYWSYVNCNDRYDEKTFDECDKILGEGLYGLVNDRVNVTVEPGDVVIDAGAWIGDFAAYASVRGAGTVYAFEPTEETFEILQKTAELNKNIVPVKKGLSDENVARKFFPNVTGNSGGNGFMIGRDNPDSIETTYQVETVTLDDFVRENSIQRVDFIKADIEGFERHMLAGAQETLARFAPKLALCTYHLPDDPQVMAELILKANPKYNIVQKRMKLFASVPK